MASELLYVIDSVVKDKGITREVIVEALEMAMLTAARKKLGANRELEAHFNMDMGEIELFEFKEVVEEVTEPLTQISLEDGRNLDSEAEIGDSLGLKLDTENFGRIAAQTAKQVIIQKVRDAERLMVYEEYKDRVGEIINGTVRRFEKGNMIIDLGRTEGILPHSEQVPRESYRAGDRIRSYVLQVHQESRGPQVVLSRRSPVFVKKIFAMEVPEIAEGIVTVESIAREPGVRTKIAVLSRDSGVDPVGACVGMKGSRVQAVVQELRGEKIDIIPWTRDIAGNVCNALAPAEVARMIIDDDQHMMLVIVPDDQLSLAIGRRGQNVRLAVQLTGWNIDIKGETEMKDLTKKAQDTLGKISGIGGVIAEKLYLEGFTTASDLAKADTEALTALPGIGKVKAEKIIQAAKEMAAQEAAEAAAAPPKTAESASPAAVADSAQAEAAAAEAGPEPTEAEAEPEEKGPESEAGR
jgi:N utilization substance protein A